MIRKAAVLAYPNSNNLGDYIQSIAAKQLISKEDIIRLEEQIQLSFETPIDYMVG